MAIGFSLDLPYDTEGAMTYINMLDFRHRNVRAYSPIFSKTSYFSDSGMLDRFLWEMSMERLGDWRDEKI